MKLEKNKLAEINVRSEHLMVSEIHKPFGFASFYWSKWAVISKILQDIRLSKGSLVLDIGCGAGWTSTFLAESGFRVTGIDIVPLNIATAKKKSKTKNFEGRFSYRRYGKVQTQ